MTDLGRLWARDDPEVGLTHENPFHVSYPQNYRSHLKDLRKLQMKQDEIDQIATNMFEHPSIDLRSIFQDFRLTGFLPPKETSPIQTFLGECQDDIKLLDAQIKDTISKIAQLTRDLTHASAQMVRRVSQVRLCKHFLSSPLEYLPQDILEQIFLACLATNEDPSPDPNCAPLQLASVCHQWRTIALSMPTLWNGIDVSSISGIELAKTWLKRSYLPSLTLRFDNDDKNNNVPSSKLEELLDILQGPSLSPRRIDILGLGGSLGDTIQKFLLERDHPVLEELVLRDFGEALPSLPKASSSLRRVYTHRPPEIWHNSPPSSQLTVLWLTSKIHGNTLIIFLASCPNLESLYVDISENGLRLEPEPCVSQDITLHRLAYLGFWDSYSTSEPPDDLLRGVSFPSLRVVEYCVSKRSTTSTLWLGFIHALNSVQRLTLQFHDALPPFETFTPLLEHAASITELSISTSIRFMSDIIVCLTSLASSSSSSSSSENQTMVLPCLQTLYLDIAFGSFPEWLPLEPQLKEFGTAWTTPPSSNQGESHSLTELVIQHRHGEYIRPEDRNETWECPKVRQMFQSACPNLCTRIVYVQSTSWLGDVPVAFGLFPGPFNSTNLHGVMEDGDTWTDKLHPVHRVM